MISLAVRLVLLALSFARPSAAETTEQAANATSMFACTDDDEGKLRVRGTILKSTGHLEICHNRTWGVICANNWGKHEADVSCRQLGFSTAKPIDPSVLKKWQNLSHPNYTKGSGPRKAWLDHILCSGSENDILQCWYGWLRRYPAKEAYKHVNQRSCFDEEKLAGVMCSQSEVKQETSSLPPASISSRIEVDTLSPTATERAHSTFTTCMRMWLHHSGIPLSLAVKYEQNLQLTQQDEESVQRLDTFMLMFLLNGNFRHATQLKHCTARVKNNCRDYNPCQTAGRCLYNSSASHHVCFCRPGLQGHLCEQDCNECSGECKLTHNCHNNGLCQNVHGSFQCTCRSGFRGSGTVCSDIDECKSPPCDPHASCSNFIGSFMCTCNPGYEGNGLLCSKICYCCKNPCKGSAECEEKNVGYICKCPVGYHGEGCKERWLATGLFRQLPHHLQSLNKSLMTQRDEFLHTLTQIEDELHRQKHLIRQLQKKVKVLEKHPTVAVAAPNDFTLNKTLEEESLTHARNGTCDIFYKSICLRKMSGDVTNTSNHILGIENCTTYQPTVLWNINDYWNIRRLLDKVEHEKGNFQDYSSVITVCCNLIMNATLSFSTAATPAQSQSEPTAWLSSHFFSSKDLRDNTCEVSMKDDMISLFACL